MVQDRTTLIDLKQERERWEREQRKLLPARLALVQRIVRDHQEWMAPEVEHLHRELDDWGARHYITMIPGVGLIATTNAWSVPSIAGMAYCAMSAKCQ